ncbi:hypothetical protein BOX15_Mlig009695g3 [Macrostomum lignano]|uniref:Secreted protein n=2 Tax=Macrostomum lignano TaxID=282301 RepID=A0A1I8GEJ4_9PLAT|nr:hypothetical protein BOX15_Mlig009695g3 [Macrostomum lignano]
MNCQTGQTVCGLLLLTLCLPVTLSGEALDPEEPVGSIELEEPSLTNYDALDAAANAGGDRAGAAGPVTRLLEALRAEQNVGSFERPAKRCRINGAACMLG